MPKRQWFISLAHARAEIERWRREYNEERPKKSFSWLAPAVYAKQMAEKAFTMPGRLETKPLLKAGGRRQACSAKSSPQVRYFGLVLALRSTLLEFWPAFELRLRLGSVRDL